MKLKDKVAIITGAGSGIGKATAEKFCAEGAKVVIADVKADVISSVVAALNENGSDAIGVSVDVTSSKDVEHLMKKTLEHYGRLDIVVNNAGVTQDAQLIKMTEEQFDKVMNVNVKGVFQIGQAAAKIMKEQQSGVILNASSVVGTYGNFGQTNYAASKWGVNGMTKTWARELGRFNIRVNAVAPGFISTPMVKKMPEKVLMMMKDKALLNRLGNPEDVANGYAFLASDEASFITGTILSVDGGVTL
ncbi:SDR family NAD(P)-dependent oxidoreductase [Alkalicoccobacillus plakortidis]|uniref:Glucose 1-dehydrogenase n=1 Tax=Alkalicoccobacillus plakortidis TaxID=444060 RepID=A0ABT0XFT4_9BACI|nr:glucose 1-dehydrogenase [Alkalicoccobacillus plakortidis]MCM2674218.1 glucose 1-dehydrogenase [Alkalicoccobacillus plakortidis]